MKNKKIILISIIGLLIIGFFSLYNSLGITNYERWGKDNYFNEKLKSIVPQNIKDFMRETIFVFKHVSILEQKLADKNKEILGFLNLSEFGKASIFPTKTMARMTVQMNGLCQMRLRSVWDGVKFT